MVCEDSVHDFQLYLDKVKQEPDPLPNSRVWADDPYFHDEEWHNRRRKSEIMDVNAKKRLRDQRKKEKAKRKRMKKNKR